jgi:hypothetical protein
MLVKSSKSRFAAMALMALGVSTFMGTSAALATGVNVTGTVGECAAASTVTANAVDFATVTKDTTGLQNLTPTITQGKDENCVPRTSTVTAAIGTFTGQAATDVTAANRVIFTIGAQDGEAFPMTAAVPSSAATGIFGATVTLTLIG